MESYPRSITTSDHDRPPVTRPVPSAARGTTLALLLVVLIVIAGRGDALAAPGGSSTPRPEATSNHRPPVLDLVVVALLRERSPRALVEVADQLVDLDAVFESRRGQPMVPARADRKTTTRIDEAPLNRLVSLPEPSRRPSGLLGGGVRPESIDPPAAAMR